MSDIPIKAAKRIAEEYGLDQVIIVGRKTGDIGVEHVTTYGAGRAHCDVAARSGMAIKHHLMRWPHALFDSALRILAVGRDAENPKTLSIALNIEPSDGDIRMVHDMLRPPTKSPQEVEDGA